MILVVIAKDTGYFLFSKRVTNPIVAWSAFYEITKTDDSITIELSNVIKYHFQCLPIAMDITYKCNSGHLEHQFTRQRQLVRAGDLRPHDLADVVIW